MRKIEKRSVFCLILAALLGIGLVIAAGCIFVWVRFRMRIVR